MDLETPLQDFSRASSPDISEQFSRTDEISCAWCKDKELNYNHHTSVCPLYSKAAPTDQWKIVDQYQLCARCFEGYHQDSECPLPPRKCNFCNCDHHELIGCRPFKTSPLLCERQTQEDKNSENVSSSLQLNCASVTFAAEVHLPPVDQSSYLTEGRNSVLFSDSQSISDDDSKPGNRFQTFHFWSLPAATFMSW